MEDRTKCAIAFCEEVKAQGYKPGVYASTLWYRKRIDLNSLKKIYHLERTLWCCQQPHRLRPVAGHLHGTPARL